MIVASFVYFHIKNLILLLLTFSISVSAFAQSQTEKKVTITEKELFNWILRSIVFYSRVFEQ